MIKQIKAHGKASFSRSMGPAVKQVIPSVVEHVEPFVFLDHFGPVSKMPGGGVPPHPHAGIATITYLFSGTVTHRDSLGNVQSNHPGDVAVMKAGKGIIHSEGINDAQQGNIHGLQLWVSLPSADKFSDPEFHSYPSAVLPVKEFKGGSVKVLMGELNGVKSPVVMPSPAFLFDIRVEPGSEVEVPISADSTCGVYIVEGNAEVNGLPAKSNTMLEFEPGEGGVVKLLAIESSKILILGGQPLNEPIVAYASFVMNTPEQIHQVIADYRDGKMGHLD